MKHNERFEYQCNVCDFKSKDLNLIKKHMVNIHMVNIIFSYYFMTTKIDIYILINKIQFSQLNLI
jgi:hypothetical protein